MTNVATSLPTATFRSSPFPCARCAGLTIGTAKWGGLCQPCADWNDAAEAVLAAEKLATPHQRSADGPTVAWRGLSIRVDQDSNVERAEVDDVLAFEQHFGAPITHARAEEIAARSEWMDTKEHREAVDQWVEEARADAMIDRCDWDQEDCCR
ncbi:MAG: hypothetical protein WAT39_23885 [Planctomycetota bacterium]